MQASKMIVTTDAGVFKLDLVHGTSSLNGGEPRQIAKLGYDGNIQVGRTLWMVLQGSVSGRARYCGRVTSIDLMDEDGNDLGQSQAYVAVQADAEGLPDSTFRKATENMTPAEFAKFVQENKPFGMIVPKKVDQAAKALLALSLLAEANFQEGAGE